MRAKLCKRDGDGGGGPSLPEEIILEVLLRLPAKALCRFRCVSKSWRALISDPAFVAALRSRATGPLIVADFGHELRLLDKGGNVLMVFDVRAGPTAALAPTRLDRIFVDRAELGAMIINPASGSDFTIAGTNNPPPPSWTKSTDVMSDYSFGRATASGDYKVLRLATLSWRWTWIDPGPERWCQVATIMDMDGSAVPTWRERPWCPFQDTGFSGAEKATVNGVLYFMPHRPLKNNFMPHNTNSEESHGRKHIVAFDLESEEWKPEKIRGPLLGHKSEDDKWSITLTELKGTLCMVHNADYLSDLVGHYADIWLLKDPNSCAWVKAYKIKMPGRSLLFTNPLDVLTDGTLLLLNMFRKAGNDDVFKNCRRYILQIYNSSTKSFTDFMEMPEGFYGTMTFYTGSLQS